MSGSSFCLSTLSIVFRAVFFLRLYLSFNPASHCPLNTGFFSFFANASVVFLILTLYFSSFPLARHKTTFSSGNRLFPAMSILRFSGNVIDVDVQCFGEFVSLISSLVCFSLPFICLPLYISSSGHHPMTCCFGQALCGLVFCPCQSDRFAIRRIWFNLVVLFKLIDFYPVLIVSAVCLHILGLILWALLSWRNGFGGLNLWSLCICLHLHFSVDSRSN